ncbi:hypothetical protein SCYAM73S_00876 [Streptomyces cyaneofuscatus]
MELLQAHLLSSKGADLAHQLHAESAAAYRRAGLHVVHGPPVPYEFERIAAHVQPARQLPLDVNGEQPARLRRQGRDDRLDGRRRLREVHGRERKTCGAPGVGRLNPRDLGTPAASHARPLAGVRFRCGGTRWPDRTGQRSAFTRLMEDVTTTPTPRSVRRSHSNETNLPVTRVQRERSIFSATGRQVTGRGEGKDATQAIRPLVRFLRQACLPEHGDSMTSRPVPSEMSPRQCTPSERASVSPKIDCAGQMAGGGRPVVEDGPVPAPGRRGGGSA